MSALPAMPIPPPRQKPRTAAITGTSQSVTGQRRPRSPAVCADQGLVPLGLDLLDATPAQKPRPSARTTTTRLSGTRPASATAWRDPM